MKDIPEADWKYMRSLKPVLLERLCERMNQATLRILNDPAKTAYERYSSIYEKTWKDNMDVASAFDDWRRSTISIRIMEIFRQGLFTAQELQGFSQQIKDRIEAHKPITKKKT